MEVFGKLKILVFNFGLTAAGMEVPRVGFTKLLALGNYFWITERLSAYTERGFIGLKEFAKTSFGGRGNLAQILRTLSSVRKFAFEIMKIVMTVAHRMFSEWKAPACSCFIPLSIGRF